MALHPALEPLAAIVGTWAGTGRGHYPTIQPFEYREELTFTDVGKPLLEYRQRTWNADGGLMHIESGYLRAPGPGLVELILAQPTGQTELLEGTIEATDDGFRLELASRVQNSSSAKQVDRTKRSYALAGDALQTTFDMAAVGVELQRHLTSALTRSA